MKKHLFTICFITVLASFTIYIVLDTFVLSSAYVTNAAQLNTEMFEGSDTDAASDTDVAGDADAGNTDVAGDAGYNNDTGDTGKHHPFDGKMPDGKMPDGKMPPDGKWSEKGKHHWPKDHDSDKDDDNGSSVDASAEYTGDKDYKDDNISIKLSEYEKYDTKIYVADITLSSAQYLKTAFAEDTYGKNITAKTSEIAASKDAILAINGDYYGVKKSGYVIRNGVVYRDTPNGSDILCICSDGTMKIVNDNDQTAQQLVDDGVWQAFSFGPSLIENGSVCVGTDDEVDMARESNPRTAIGLIDKNHFVFVVSDGRTNESAGLSLYELAQFMSTLGVKTAYNLDGGGSTTMYFNGQIVNNPTSGGSRIKEREISDIVYIK